ncbi:MAG: hypothetical protein EOO47_02700 [Flavobacterium sp.]|nr:MAG: hypothetical protein EOO47_02700 [Flavobacterium sp.]
MKPTEPNKPLENELIAHIRASLVEHEEEYLPGAWEKFNEEKPTKKTPIIWLNVLRGVAALLVLGVLGYFLTDKKETQQPVEVAKVNSKSVESKPSQATTIEPTDSTPSINNGALQAEQFKASKNPFVKENEVVNKDAIITSDQDLVIVKNNTDVTAPINTVTQPKEVAILPKEVALTAEQNVLAKAAKVETKPSIIEFFDSETKKNQADKNMVAKNKSNNKFTLGVVVAPSFGNVNKLNMGYGVSVDYSLSDKFSLNSGIAYNQMTAGKNDVSSFDGAMNSPTNSAIIARQSTRSLAGVQEQVAGIDIPLEIKYHVSKNLYANVGVSAFAVISQKQNNTYLENRVEQRVSSVGEGSMQISSVLVTDKVTEKADPGTATDYSYLGFYNFSFGYKKKISKNNSFAVEPFVKLPMREVNTQNLRLIGTGVKLKFDF